MDCKQSQWRIPVSYLLIYLFALFWRGFYLWEIRHAPVPVFSILIGDAECFDVWAQSIWKGDWIGKEVFYQAPLYPYLLGLIYTVFGRNLLIVKIIQIVIGSLSCVFIAMAGARFFSRKTGWIAGLLLAIYPSAVFFDGLTQKAFLYLWFMTVVLAMVGKNLSQLRSGSIFSGGIILGLFSLTRENAMILIAAVSLWLWFGFPHEPRKKRGVCIILLVIGATMVFLPVALRNKIVGNDFLITTSNFGTNLYIGNNSESDGKYKPLLPGRGNWLYERQDATEIAEKVVGRKMSPAEVSQFWAKRALAFMRESPLAWGKLMLRKWALVWNATEIADTESIYGYALISVLLRVLNIIFHFGILFPLAVLGVCATFKQREKIWILYLMAILYAASVVIFFVFSRYRHPLTAILILFAAAGIAEIKSLFIPFPNQKALVALGLVLAAVLFSNFAVSSLEGTRIVAAYNWDKTVSLQKAKIEKLYRSGKEFMGSGKSTEAMACFQEVIQLDPDFTMAYVELGQALSDQGRTKEALDIFHQALKRNPGQPDVYKRLGSAFQKLGQVDEAAINFKKALLLEPKDMEAQLNLNSILKFKPPLTAQDMK